MTLLRQELPGIFRSPERFAAVSRVRWTRKWWSVRSILLRTDSRKAFLDQVMWIVEQMDRAVGSLPKGGHFAVRVRQECKAMVEELRPVRADALWKQVGPMVSLPISSQVLQSRRGYREILATFRCSA